jgi:hypothetical protein
MDNKENMSKSKYKIINSEIFDFFKQTRYDINDYIDIRYLDQEKKLVDINFSLQGLQGPHKIETIKNIKIEQETITGVIKNINNNIIYLTLNNNKKIIKQLSFYDILTYNNDINSFTSGFENRVEPRKNVYKDILEYIKKDNNNNYSDNYNGLNSDLLYYYNTILTDQSMYNIFELYKNMAKNMDLLFKEFKGIYDDTDRHDKSIINKYNGNNGNNGGDGTYSKTSEYIQEITDLSYNFKDMTFEDFQKHFFPGCGTENYGDSSNNIQSKFDEWENTIQLHIKFFELYNFKDIKSYLETQKKTQKIHLIGTAFESFENGRITFNNFRIFLDNYYHTVIEKLDDAFMTNKEKYYYNTNDGFIGKVDTPFTVKNAQKELKKIISTYGNGLGPKDKINNLIVDLNLTYFQEFQNLSMDFLVWGSNDKITITNDIIYSIIYTSEEITTNNKWHYPLLKYMWYAWIERIYFVNTILKNNESAQSLWITCLNNNNLNNFHEAFLVIKKEFNDFFKEFNNNNKLLDLKTNSNTELFQQITSNYSVWSSNTEKSNIMKVIQNLISSEGFYYFLQFLLMSSDSNNKQTQTFFKDLNITFDFSNNLIFETLKAISDDNLINTIPTNTDGVNSIKTYFDNIIDILKFYITLYEKIKKYNWITTFNDDYSDINFYVKDIDILLIETEFNSMDTIIKIITEDYDNAKKSDLSYKSIYEKYKLLDENYKLLNKNYKFFNETNTNYINNNFFNIYKTLYDYFHNKPTVAAYLTSTSSSSSGIKFSAVSNKPYNTDYHVADIRNIKIDDKFEIWAEDKNKFSFFNPQIISDINSTKTGNEIYSIFEYWLTSSKAYEVNWKKEPTNTFLYAISDKFKITKYNTRVPLKKFINYHRVFSYIVYYSYYILSEISTSKMVSKSLDDNHQINVKISSDLNDSLQWYYTDYKKNKESILLTTSNKDANNLIRFFFDRNELEENFVKKGSKYYSITIDSNSEQDNLNNIYINWSDITKLYDSLYLNWDNSSKKIILSDTEIVKKFNFKFSTHEKQVYAIPCNNLYIFNLINKYINNIKKFNEEDLVNLLPKTNIDNIYFLSAAEKKNVEIIIEKIGHELSDLLLSLSSKEMGEYIDIISTTGQPYTDQQIKTIVGRVVGGSSTDPVIAGFVDIGTDIVGANQGSGSSGSVGGRQGDTAGAVIGILSKFNFL